MKKRLFVFCMVLVLAASVLSGCGGETTGSDEVTTIKWYLPGVREGADNAMVLAEVNKLLEERYKLKLDTVFIDSGSYGQKMNAMNSAGETYDLACLGSSNSFYSNVSNGCLADLTELLPKYAPKTFASMGKDTWQCVTHDDKIYAVPNWQIQAKSTALFIDKAVLDMAGMSIDEINTINDFETYLEKVAALNTDVNFFPQAWEQFSYAYGIQPLMIGKVAAVRFKEEGKPTIFNMFETEEFKEYVKLREKWVDNGWVTDEYSPGTSYTTLRRSLGSLGVYTPGADVTISKNKGYPMVMTQLSDAVFASDTVNAALTGVSATSKHPEKALEMIEVMNTDKEIYNMMLYGIEGKHYTKIGENKIRLVEGSQYDIINYFNIGSQANSYLIEGQPDNLIEATREINDTAYVSPTNSINFDTSRIESEIANCTTVVNEQLLMIDRGIAEEGALEKFIKDLKASGADKIIEELQRQVDQAWKQ